MKRALIGLTTVGVVALAVWLGTSLLKRSMNVAVGPSTVEAAEPARLPASLPARPIQTAEGYPPVDYDPARDPNATRTKLNWLSLLLMVVTVGGLLNGLSNGPSVICPSRLITATDTPLRAWTTA